MDNRIGLFKSLKNLLVKENLKVFYRGGLASLAGVMTLSMGTVIAE